MPLVLIRERSARGIDGIVVVAESVNACGPHIVTEHLQFLVEENAVVRAGRLGVEALGYRVAIAPDHERLARRLLGGVVNSQIDGSRAIDETRRKPCCEPLRHKRADLAVSRAFGRVLLRRGPLGELVRAFGQFRSVGDRNRARG